MVVKGRNLGVIILALSNLGFVGTSILLYNRSHDLISIILLSFSFIVFVFSSVFLIKGNGKINESTTKELDAKERMVAAVAHEIKNPLNSIKGANQYLHGKYKDKEDIQEFTDIVIQEIDRVEKILNEFMSFSRGVKLRLKEYELESFITGIIVTVKHIFPTEIVVVKKQKSFPAIVMDGEQMKQVMVNLLYNAKDAIKDLSEPKTEVILDFNDKYFIISVKDNGRGISDADVDSVFTPFYTTKKEGLGLGLSISKTIVNKHNGELGFGTSADKGTIFTIKIPVLQRGKL